MAKTITKREVGKSGRLRCVYLRITLDNSYPTGGYPLSVSEIGLGEIEHWSISPEGTGYRVEYDFANKKLKVFSAAGTEASAATNFSTLKLRCKFDGY